MKKNKIKDTIHLILIIILVLSVLALIFIKNEIIKGIFAVIMVIAIILYNIINITIWKCPKCGKHLPDNKILFHNIDHCPYCDANIEDDK